MTISFAPATSGFDRWDELHALLAASFAFMEYRIDPPSSLLSMGPATLAEKAEQEKLLLATEDGRIAGCVFLRAEADVLYIGKLAVDARLRGRGVARRLIEMAEAEARRTGLPFLELQTRIELTENHETFARLGFVKSGETAHAGFDRATSITMRKRVA